MDDLFRFYSCSDSVMLAVHVPNGHPPEVDGSVQIELPVDPTYKGCITRRVAALTS